MGLFDSIGSFFGGGKGGGWKSALSLGLDLFNLDRSLSASRDAERFRKEELEALKRASAVQTARDVADLRRSKLRTMASINAMAAASGVNAAVGTPTTVREEAGRLYDRDISRVLEDAKLRKDSLTLQQAYAGRAGSLNRQSSWLDFAGSQLNRFL